MHGELCIGDAVNWDSPLNRGLASWWLALPGQSRGNVFRDLALRNSGVLTNGPTWTGARGRPGGWGALGFVKASSQFVSAPSPTVTAGSSITVAFWILTAGGEESSSWSIGAELDDLNRIHSHTPWSDNNVYWDYGQSDNGRVSASFTAHLNKWTHVVLLAVGSFQAIYFDGQIAASRSEAVGPTIDRTGLMIGAGYAETLRYSTNAQDDFRIYNRGLSSAEILSLYQASRQGYPNELNWQRRRSYSVLDEGGGGEVVYRRLALMGVGT